MGAVPTITSRVPDEAYDTAIRENTKASVDSTTGESDATISEKARLNDMTEKRLLDAADDQRRRGAAFAAYKPPVEPTVAPAGTPSVPLSQLDPYLKA